MAQFRDREKAPHPFRLQLNRVTLGGVLHTLESSLEPEIPGCQYPVPSNLSILCSLPKSYTALYSSPTDCQAFSLFCAFTKAIPLPRIVSLP